MSFTLNKDLIVINKNELAKMLNVSENNTHEYLLIRLEKRLKETKAVPIQDNYKKAIDDYLNDDYLNDDNERNITLLISLMKANSEMFIKIGDYEKYAKMLMKAYEQNDDSLIQTFIKEFEECVPMIYKVNELLLDDFYIELFYQFADHLHENKKLEGFFKNMVMNIVGKKGKELKGELLSEIIKCDNEKFRKYFN